MIDERICICLCEEIPHAVFLKNMVSGMKEKNINMVFLTANLSVYMFLKEHNVSEIVLVKKGNCNCPKRDMHTVKECLDGSLSLEEARTLYTSTYNEIRKYSEKNKIDMIIASQGLRAAELALKDFAKERNIKVIFFELSNIPAKTFFDVEGSNAKSWLYEHIDVLDKFIVDDIEYKNWRENYLKTNFKNHEVKQAVSFTKLNWKHGLLSRFGYLYTGVKVKRVDVLKKFTSLIEVKIMGKIKYDRLDLLNTRYIFFPMQVSCDSQVIINSDIKLFDALEYCISQAKQENAILVVKLHPAEPDLQVIKRVMALRRKYNFKVVNDNTFFVIKNAFKVITINSTVALESMIIGKTVEILGRSYYKKFNYERLKCYILRYLVDLDYFADKPFTLEEINGLYDRFISKR